MCEQVPKFGTLHVPTSHLICMSALCVHKRRCSEHVVIEVTMYLCVNPCQIMWNALSNLGGKRQSEDMPLHMFTCMRCNAGNAGNHVVRVLNNRVS